MKLAVGFILFEDATAKYLADFLPSLYQALGFLQPDKYQVYAIDNSQTGNEENFQILSEFQKKLLQPLRNGSGINYQRVGKNIGFSRAYNLMLRLAAAIESEYFLIINPDTQLDSDSIRQLILALDSDGSFGSAAPKILHWDYKNRQQTKIIDSLGIVLGPGLRFYDLNQGLVDQASAGTTQILGPSGAAGLYRMSALKEIATRNDVTGQLDFFDENFFMYKEDCDLAYRLFLAGYRSALVLEAIIYHDRTAGSSGRGFLSIFKDHQSKSRLVKAWSLRNQLYIYRKYWSKQNFFNKLAILRRAFMYFISYLILDKYLLKEFQEIWRRR